MKNRNNIYVTFYLLVTFCMFAPFSAHADVVCDKFELKTKLQDSVLELSVDTDLPDDTEVFVSVYRTYRQKGDPDEYSIDYFAEKSTIEKWKSKHKISIDNKKWKSDLKAHQKQMDKLGLGFDVGSINKKVIAATVIVPIRQSNPEFGKRNSKLTGKAVIIRSNIRNVHGEVEIEHPLDVSGLEKSPPSLHALTLDVGHSYVISKRIPLMTTHSLKVSHAELMKTKQIYKGGVIKILDSVINAEGNRWYKVEALNRDNNVIGKGWVNSVSLMRQNLEIRN